MSKIPIKLSSLVSKVLFGINILIIAAMLFLSLVMIYFTSSEHRVIMGHTALIYRTYDSNQESQYSFYLIDVNQKSTTIGAEVMFMMLDQQWTNTPVIDTIVSTSGDLATLKGGEILDITAPQFIGTVVSSNATLGEKLHTFTSSQTPLLLYVLFGGGFVILSLVVVLIFAIKLRRSTLLDTTPRLRIAHDLDSVVLEDDGYAKGLLANPDITKPACLQSDMDEFTLDGFDNDNVTTAEFSIADTTEIDITPKSAKPVDAIIDSAVDSDYTKKPANAATPVTASNAELSDEIEMILKEILRQAENEIHKS